MLVMVVVEALAAAAEAAAQKGTCTTALSVQAVQAVQGAQRVMPVRVRTPVAVKGGVEAAALRGGRGVVMAVQHLAEPPTMAVAAEEAVAVVTADALLGVQAAEEAAVAVVTLEVPVTQGTRVQQLTLLRLMESL